MDRGSRGRLTAALSLMVHFVRGVGVGGFPTAGAGSLIRTVIGGIARRLGGGFRRNLRLIFKFVVFKGFHNVCLLICFLDIKLTAYL